MTMVIMFEFRIRDEIGTSVNFDIKNENTPPKCWHFEDDCVPNGSTGKVAAWGVLIYSWNMRFSGKMQIFFNEWK